MDGRGRYHLTTQKLKNWILKDVKNIVNLHNVDNTSDMSKPLSIPQEKAVDAKLKKVREEFLPRTQDLYLNKADLVNGVVPLTQIPLKLRDDAQIHVNMSDINDSISTAISASNQYLLSEQDRKIAEHEYAYDPHNVIPYIDQEILRLSNEVTDHVGQIAYDIEPTIIQFLNTRLSNLGPSSTIQDLLDTLRT